MNARDVKNKRFAVKMRGYAVAEVDLFMEEVTQALETAQAREDDLKSALSDANNQLAYLRGIETALRDAMVSAQQKASQIEDDARAQAEMTVSQAQEQADALTRQAEEALMDAQTQAQDMLDKAREQALKSVNDLEAQRSALEEVIGQYRAKVRQLMAGQLDAMEQILGDLGE